MKKIKADIDGKNYFIELIDNAITDELLKMLPMTIDLTCWGNEAYGSTSLKMKAVSPQASIVPGGIAYSEQGPYLCIFYGQTPAWPVDYIGKIQEDDWKDLVGKQHSRLILQTLQE